MNNLQVCIPDFRVINALSCAGLLHVLLPRFVITDVVDFCVNSQFSAFSREHKDAVIIARTGFHEQIRQARGDPDFPLPPDIGELSIYDYLNEIARTRCDMQALVILDDSWFSKNQLGTMPPGVQVVSLSEYIKDEATK